MKSFIFTFITALIAATALGAAAASTTLPTTTQASTTAPTTNPYEALRGMTPDYLVLTNRSIFMKGAQIVDPFRQDAQPTPPEPVHYVAESSLEFNGATRADDNRAAFFENTSTHEVMMKHVGDSIARGKILSITLDTLQYQADGRITNVAIGQTLDGSLGPSMSSAPSISMNTTQPVGNFTGPHADMLEQLRQKRLKELGQ